MNRVCSSSDQMTQFEEQSKKIVNVSLWQLSVFLECHRNRRWKFDLWFKIRLDVLTKNSCECHHRSLKFESCICIEWKYISNVKKSRYAERNWVIVFLWYLKSKLNGCMSFCKYMTNLHKIKANQNQIFKVFSMTASKIGGRMCCMAKDICAAVLQLYRFGSMLRSLMSPYLCLAHHISIVLPTSSLKSRAGPHFVGSQF